jgi:hypothetical protein
MADAICSAFSFFGRTGLKEDIHDPLTDDRRDPKTLAQLNAEYLASAQDGDVQR